MGDGARGAPTKVDGIRGALSKEGVTMVGCIDPRKVAMDLAGFANQEQWQQDVHKINAKLKEAERGMKESAKAEKRAKKKDEEEEAQMGDDTEGQIGLITLRPMLKISLAEAVDADIDTLIMLSKGIAYACGSGTEPMVKRLYNQALLTVPDSLQGRAPPLNVLVVDYSSHLRYGLSRGGHAPPAGRSRSLARLGGSPAVLRSSPSRRDGYFLLPAHAATLDARAERGGRGEQGRGGLPERRRTRGSQDAKRWQGHRRGGRDAH